MSAKYDPTRDLDPHKAARMALWLWSAEYARQAKGSMGFWDLLDERRKRLAREAVAEILKARDERTDEK